MRLRFLNILLFIGCSAVTPKIDVESIKERLYRKDMKIEANDYKGHGVLVVPRENKYKMKIKALGNLDLFTFQTCHREMTQEDAGKKGGFLGIGKDKKLAQLEFAPSRGIEDDGSCPIDIGGYEKKKGRHSWGAIILENKKFTLPSVVRCNGQTTQYRGTSACQSRAGLIQRIEFSVPVGYDLDPNCKYEGVKMTEVNIFEYQIPEGQCVTYFREKADKKRYSEHHDYGYTKIIILGK
ncbi:MAG: hypothetical protein ACPG5Z_00180 [Pseudoalteromonas sp.]